jgi:hypothetical protein
MHDRLGRTLVSLFIAMCGSVAPAIGQASTPVVVELFTSQGCSSCPPADALLGEISRKPNVIALAYHVDYWDELGWKDPFSIPEAAQRQRGYVRRLSKSGDTSFVGSNRADMKEAIAADRDALEIALSKTQASLAIDLAEPWHQPMDVYVVSYLDHATTKVGRGENARRSLQEFNIVRSFKRIGKWSGKPQKMSVPLASLPRDATSVVVLLQRPEQGAIAGAAALSLR